jgi:hypothetical protein
MSAWAVSLPALDKKTCTGFHGGTNFKCYCRRIVVIVGCGTEDYYRFTSIFEAHPLPSSWQSSCELPERGFGHNMETHLP